MDRGKSLSLHQNRELNPVSPTRLSLGVMATHGALIPMFPVRIGEGQPLKSSSRYKKGRSVLPLPSFFALWLLRLTS